MTYTLMVVSNYKIILIHLILLLNLLPLVEEINLLKSMMLHLVMWHLIQPKNLLKIGPH